MWKIWSISSCTTWNVIAIIHIGFSIIYLGEHFLLNCLLMVGSCASNCECYI